MHTTDLYYWTNTTGMTHLKNNAGCDHFFSESRKQMVFSHYEEQVVTVTDPRLLLSFKGKHLATKRHCKWHEYQQLKIINTISKDNWHKVLVFGVVHCLIWAIMIHRDLVVSLKKKKKKNRPHKHTHKQSKINYFRKYRIPCDLGFLGDLQ